jgi:hypothetical protein
MRRFLLVIILSLTTLILQAQKDTTNAIGPLPQNDISRNTSSVNITIYPVPVRHNSFTIKADRDISFVRITNIIGQDIYRIKYNDPLQLIKIMLDNPKRGMYLVTIIFDDGTRTVKKIMVEESE